MNYTLIVVAVLMVIGGLVALYRHWDPPEDGGDEKILFLTKKQITNHSLVGAFSSIIIGIFILLIIILS